VTPIFNRVRRQAAGDASHCAVIDIGSNTVRLVVYTGSGRAPETLLNEKVTARLGRDLAATGRISDKAQEIALAGLRRFNLLLQGLGVREVTVVATAAARDAENGGEFLQRVREIGFEPRLLSGEEEAVASAAGVIAAFPDAHGVVADLGGGSLELVCVEDGKANQGVSLPFGTLRLESLRKKGSRSFKGFVHRSFANVGWAVAHPGPLYLVGGTWRAFARTAMLHEGSPLTDTHGFELAPDEAERIARQLILSDVALLKDTAGLTSVRADALPDAAALLRVMLAELQPSGLVFSSWGLREGLLYQRLSPVARRQDPLLLGVARFAAPFGGSAARATMMTGWTAEAVAANDAYGERLRLAATMLALAAMRLEPNLRVGHAIDWALHKRWIGLDVPGRARIAAALTATSGKTGLRAELLGLASEAQLYEAIGWGLALRLCRRIGAGSRLSLTGSTLNREEGRLVLRFERGAEALANDNVAGDLAMLAGWLGLRHAIELSGTVR
jgi:exopolyphosphatase/guanosine-5'-triphosphate,3'-diphosphate pyrophosphatase